MTCCYSAGPGFCRRERRVLEDRCANVLRLLCAFAVGSYADYTYSSFFVSLPSRRLPVECAFSPDRLFEAQFRPGNRPNLREGGQLR